MDQQLELIQLAAGDDYYSVRDRLAELRGKHVLLVWPDRGTALNSLLDLRLVQRAAKRYVIRLALVTQDAAVIHYANKLSISTFETIDSGIRAKWRRGRTGIFAGRWQRPEADVAPEALMPVASRLRIEADETGMQRLLRLLSRLGIILLLLGVGLTLMYLLIPSATITIAPAREQPERTIIIIAEPDRDPPIVDVEDAIIPARTLTETPLEEATTRVSGSRTLDSRPATGSVIFINKTTDPVNVPAGTLISTGPNATIQFQTTEPATVDAGQGIQREVQIEAAATAIGGIGNVERNQITTVVDPALAALVDVRNEQPTSGGTDQTVPAVSSADRDNLLASLRQQIQSRALAEMRSQLRPTEAIILSTLRITRERDDWTIFDHEVGDITDTLTQTMTAEVQAIAVDGALAQQVAFARLAAEIPQGRVIESISYDEWTPTVQIDDDGFINFEITARANVTANVNQGELRQQLAGRSPEDALRYLRTQVDLADAPSQIALQPDWLPLLPLLPNRINIQTLQTVEVQP
ncbi:MAG: hypothetical protein GYB67_06350 [Chloroflexi bacterium]|nr:hypothetical protein [Chloroflexota bacterium]